MKRIALILIVLLAFLGLSACRMGPDTAALAGTMVAQTEAAITQTAVAASPTPLPPTSTVTPTATKTPRPSPTPSITPTPGPFSYTDDFSEKKARAWSSCDKCDWKDGEMIFGPFIAGSNPGENLNFVICDICGERKFYKMSVDVTFVDGQVDRFFGVIGPVSKDHIYYMGLSPFQAAVVRDYDYSVGLLKPLANDTQGLVKAGKATNHLEIIVKPAANNPALMDVYFMLNGKNFYVLTGRKAEKSMVGLAMSFHSVTVAYDNFYYEEIEVGK